MYSCDKFVISIVSILGLTSKGLYFCPFCEVKQSDLVKGSPHCPEFQQYSARTYENIVSNCCQFQAAGGEKAHAKVRKTFVWKNQSNTYFQQGTIFSQGLSRTPSQLPNPRCQF